MSSCSNAMTRSINASRVHCCNEARGVVVVVAMELGRAASEDGVVIAVVVLVAVAEFETMGRTDDAFWSDGEVMEENVVEGDEVI